MRVGARGANASVRAEHARRRAEYTCRGARRARVAEAQRVLSCRAKAKFQKRSKFHKVETDLSRPIAQDTVKHRLMHVAILKNILVRSVAAK